MSSISSSVLRATNTEEEGDDCSSDRKMSRPACTTFSGDLTDQRDDDKWKDWFLWMIKVPYFMRYVANEDLLQLQQFHVSDGQHADDPTRNDCSTNKVME